MNVAGLYLYNKKQIIYNVLRQKKNKRREAAFVFLAEIANKPSAEQTSECEARACERGPKKKNKRREAAFVFLAEIANKPSAEQTSECEAYRKETDYETCFFDRA